MHAATVQDPFRRIVLPLFFFALLLICVLTLPPLSLPLALLMPLIVCPARISTGLWFSLLMALLPSVGLLSAGANPLLALSPLPFSCFALLVSIIADRSRLEANAAALWQAVAMLASLALLCAQVSYMLGGDLFHSLADYLTDSLANSPNANAYLYYMVQAGFLPLSSQTELTAAALLKQHVFLVPSVKTECLNAFRFQIFDILRQGLPSLLVQISLTIGLFTALHTAREGVRQNPVSLPLGGKGGKEEAKALPSFRAFYLPASYQRCLFTISFLSLLLFFYGRGEVVRLVSVMMFSTVAVTFSLLGAATWVFLLCRGHARRTLFAGLSAGALLLLYPTILFILGLCDQFLHIRVAALFQQDHEEE